MTTERAVSSHGLVAPALCRQLPFGSYCWSADTSKEGYSGHSEAARQLALKAVPDGSAQDLGMGVLRGWHLGARVSVVDDADREPGSTSWSLQAQPAQHGAALWYLALG